LPASVTINIPSYLPTKPGISGVPLRCSISEMSCLAKLREEDAAFSAWFKSWILSFPPCLSSIEKILSPFLVVLHRRWRGWLLRTGGDRRFDHGLTLLLGNRHPQNEHPLRPTLNLILNLRRIAPVDLA